MPGKRDIMHAIRQGLDGLPLTLQDSTADWTKGIKTMLCKLGHKFGYQTYGALGRGEWLYDVTWMAYSQGYEQNDENNLVDAHLVAECEWGSFPEIKDDFEKLLLSRASVRLMIYGDFQIYSDSCDDGIAKRLAGFARDFNGARAEDAWLLATWEKSDNADKGWRFRYFTFGLHGEALTLA